MRKSAADWLERLSRWALAGLLVTLPFWRHRVLFHRKPEIVFFEFQDVILYTSDVFWLGAIAAWVLSLLLTRHSTRLRYGPWFITGPLLGLLLLGIIGTPYSVDVEYSAYQVLRLILLFLLYVLLQNLPLAPSAVAWPLAAGMVVQAGVSLPQFMLGHSVGLKRVGEVIVDASWSGTSVVMSGAERWLRAYGFAQHPNLLAGCLIVMLLLVAGCYLAEQGWRRALLLIALGLGWATFLLTFSRGAWVGMLLGVAAGLLLGTTSRRNWGQDWTGIVLLALVISVITLVFVVANWRFLLPRMGVTSQGTEVRSIASRATQVRAAWALLRMRPWLGVGLGGYPAALHLLVQDMVAGYPEYQPIHNVVLLVTAELGLPGGVLWLTLMTLPWLSVWRQRNRLHVTRWFAALSGALLGLFVVSLIDFYTWTSHQGRLALWIVLGLWAREWTLVGAIDGGNRTVRQQRTSL